MIDRSDGARGVDGQNGSQNGSLNSQTLRFAIPLLIPPPAYLVPRCCC